MQIKLDYMKSLPKIELHNHLEGTIDPKTFHKLAKKNSDGKYSQSIDECSKLYDFNNFQEFLLAFATVNQYIRNLSDVELIIKDYFSRIKEENYHYVEFFLSLDTFKKNGFHIPELLDKIRQSFRLYSKDIVTGINIDFVRNYGPKSAGEILNELEIDEYRDLIFGISIGGDEEKYPASPFKNLYEKARLMGLKTTAHTGEVMGPDSIWDTILELKPDRLGHGINAIKSIDLLNHLKATQTPLEISPTSNLKTNSIKSPLHNHPIRKLYDKGVNITINTDDSGFFDTSISQEYYHCVNIFDFSIQELKLIIEEAGRSIFLPEIELKQKVLLNLKNELEKI